MENADSSCSSVDAHIPGKLRGMILCLVLGIGFDLPWGTILTIDDYYYHVFPNYHPARVLSLVKGVFDVLLMAVLTYNEANIDTRKRNLSGYIIYFLTSLGLLLIDVGTSGKGGIRTYIGVCVMIAISSIACALVGGGMIGDLSYMCPEFNQSFFSGMAASGAFTSGLRLITKAAFDRSEDGLRKGALLFLAISTLFEFLCIFLYGFVLGKLQIVKHFRKKAASEGSKTVIGDLANVGIHAKKELQSRLSIKQLLLQNADYVVNIFVLYTLTMSIIPGFLYENTGTHQLGSWYGIVLITMSCVWDLIGRNIPFIDRIRSESRKGLLIACFARILFIPCFYILAKYGDQGWMIFLVSCLGLSHGYLTVCVVRVAPKGYKAPEQNALGNIILFFMGLGLLFGLSLGWLWIIGNGSF